MKLSDLIKGLQGLQATHGDLKVLERRQVSYGATELFPHDIVLAGRVLAAAGWHEKADGTHHYHEDRYVPADANDRRPFTAFVL